MTRRPARSGYLSDTQVTVSMHRFEATGDAMAGQVAVFFAETGITPLDD